MLILGRKGLRKGGGVAFYRDRRVRKFIAETRHDANPKRYVVELLGGIRRNEALRKPKLNLCNERSSFCILVQSFLFT